MIPYTGRSRQQNHSPCDQLRKTDRAAVHSGNPNVFSTHPKQKDCDSPWKTVCEVNLLASSLIGQNQGVTSIESNDPGIKAFDKVVRKYSTNYAVDCAVDYAIKKVKDENGKHKYVIFFKGRDNDAITSAFKEYTVKSMEKAKKPSVLKKLHEVEEKVQNKVLEITKDRQRGLTR